MELQPEAVVLQAEDKGRAEAGKGSRASVREEECLGYVNYCDLSLGVCSCRVQEDSGGCMRVTRSRMRLLYALIKVAA